MNVCEVCNIRLFILNNRTLKNIDSILFEEKDLYAICHLVLAPICSYNDYEDYAVRKIRLKGIEVNGMTKLRGRTCSFFYCIFVILSLYRL